MTLDRDGTAGEIDRPAAPADQAPPPPPPDRPGAEGTASRAASRAAARAPDRPAAPEPTGDADVDLPEPREAPDDEPQGVDGEARKAAETDDPPDDGPPPAERPVQAAAQAAPARPFSETASSRPAEQREEAVERPLYPAVTDHSGYAFSEREFAFSGVSPEQVWDMRTQRAPLGMRPGQWDECVVELRAALEFDGFGDAEVRLQGPGARFCSQDPRKWFPQNESELRAKVIQRHRGASDDERLRRADNAVAKYRAAGFSQERPKPITAFFDGMYKLDATGEPDCYEFQIVDSGRDLERDSPALRGWVRRWEAATGRGVSLVIADRGHADAGLREDDWMVIEPEREGREGREEK
ncbi:hypothetical protein [Actinomadura sp. 3N508]|uniref:hypothetical protein n=1 Tax=Actinomadura sp. 3N508 TaxID=3375153 RepID=UPI00378C53F4